MSVTKRRGGRAPLQARPTKPCFNAGDEPAKPGHTENTQ
jgi:hypothetical protein